MKAKKSIMIGAIAGLLIVIITVPLATLNKAWDNEALRRVINLIVSVPTLILDVKLNLPQILQNLLFFAYWTIVGAAIALLMTRKNPAFKMLAVMCLIALIFIHRAVQINLEREFDEALRGLGEIFGGKTK
ncbi:MAG TPA: hypothetical protein DCL35_05520 [Candidatus Omnitrophica bacterium]|nr:hypothetical protein [Candidatus Omnitrophota bacterium]